ncbi:uncharacterized protein LOC115984856 [Quercus lobata]|uniref:uncharacterized protein LOC115984856 n=1 Tax=Quercus lobata TaxID=97700 RepID=UPI001244EDF5|nr:uncharacterized protein LOC115984856 [Quercus lobata]
MSSDKMLILTNVFYVPDIKKNLVSANLLCKSSVKVVLELNKLNLSKNGIFVGNGYATDVFSALVLQVSYTFVGYGVYMTPMYNSNHATYGEVGDKYYGMTANMNLWNPYTQERNEFSLSQFWLINGEYGHDLDSIEADAMVYESLYQDKNTRLFISWTDDAYQSTGCYNLLRPGFVQVDKQIAMGATVTPYSKYDGKQYALKFYVWKDVNGGGDWWMNINHRVFGYWPSSIFSILSDSALRVRWGGEVINYNSRGQHTTTQMGNGHFAEEGPGKASFFKHLNVIDGKQIQRAPRDPTTFMTKPNCYNIIDYGGFFYFGGLGRNPNCP